MFLSREIKKIANLFLPCIAAIVFAIVGIMLFCKNNVFAAIIDPPSYLNISTNKSFFEDGDTIFLSDDETLSITLGKPAAADDIKNGNTNITNQNDVGEYALSMLQGAFSLKINNIVISNLQDQGFLNFYSYSYQPTPTSEAKVFMWMELEIDLSKDIFPSGEYTLSFSTYAQSSGTNFSYSENASFSVTLFVFETTEYFATDAAANQNTTFENVEISTPNTVMYRNYYYFNYSNLSTLTKENTVNYLPKLSFDASKFELNVSKSVSGSKYACTISKFNDTLITLSETTTTNFLTARYDQTSNTIEIVFNDLGEYVLDYTFIYENYRHEKIQLESMEISSINEKSDVLYLFGFQIFYNGKSTPENEFKILNENQDATQISQSADITYLIDGKNHQKVIKSTNPAVDFEEDDQTIKSLISSKNILPVSTNQPAVVLSSNANINTQLSQFYVCTYDLQNQTWNFGQAQSFQNNPFTANGIYLVKMVYDYDYYYTTSLSRETQFVQYFFFKIDTAVPDAVITDSSLQILNSYAFTKNNVSIKFEAQSPFNSSSTLEVYSKPFGSSNYVLTSTTIGTAVDQFLSFADEGNYMTKLIYGKNQNKSKTTYFTIDKTEISEIKVVPVVKNEYTNKFEKSEKAVKFFTNQNVVVEWSEKQSGAQTKAYYKYIPFTSATDIIDYPNGITTNQMLNFDVLSTYEKASYVNAKQQITGSSVFSNQGLYIVYITDEAGHEKNISFCIDKSNVQVLQFDDNEEKIISSHETILNDKSYFWGNYKLISLNLNQSDIENIADGWIKSALENLISQNDNIRLISSKLFFSVEISDVYALQTGTSLKLITNTTNKFSDIKIMSETLDGLQYANEITYSFFLMDEANLLFDEFQTLIGQDTTLAQAQTFAMNADKSFQVTTTTDASRASIVINPTQSITDVSLISSSSATLLQAGFADSKIQPTAQSADLRTKYHFATGNALENNINILSYRIKLEITESLSVSKITVLYYPFVRDLETGAKILSQTATKNVVYDKTNGISSLTALSGQDNLGFFAFNVNVDYSNASNVYCTLDGKYVIVREYSSAAQTNDFAVRENVFVVDHEGVVSSPEVFGEGSVSSVGGGIFVNMLDGNQNAVQFKNIYSAKNLGTTSILQTNKLPVVVYVPTAKYGLYTIQNGIFAFEEDQTLAYYLHATEDDKLIRFTYLENQSITEETSDLQLAYFGNIVCTSNFAQNKQIFRSTDFDLSLKATNQLGQTLDTTTNNLGYLMSAPMISTGKYYIEITQNLVNGQFHPNVFSKFEFAYQIIESPPQFVFAAQNAMIGTSFDQDPSGNFYTNQTSFVKVMWTDPADTKYFATVDIEANQNGNTKIYYFFTNAAGTAISANTYVKRNDIIMEFDNVSSYYFLIDVSNVPEGSILNVYMQNQRGETLVNTAELIAATSATEKLVFDVTAPTQVLESLIEKTTLEEITFAEYTRTYVNLEGVNATNGEKMYNVPVTSGALAKYAFLVQNTEQNPLANLFATKPAINGYFTDGYYYNIKKVSDLAQYSLPNLTSAITTAKTLQNQAYQTFTTGTYYEITEVDLAGNASIYLIFVASAADHTVLKYNSEETDIEQTRTLTFANLSTTQDVYAKNFLQVTNLNLYNYRFLQFNLDGETFFMSSALQPDQCYRLSSITSPTSGAESVNISSLINFTAPSAHTLILNNSLTGQNITINLYVSNAELTFNLLTSSEGIQISNAQTQNIKHFLQSIEITSYNNSLDKYVVIYEAQNQFSSNSAVLVTNSANSTTFTINNPELAYTYVFFDNYGNKYVEHHTVNSFVLNDDQKIKNHLGTMQITETVDNKPSTNTWWVGKTNITYNYSSSDYFAYIKIFALQINGDKAIWKLMTESPNSPYGIAISSQSNYSITDGQNVLCTISTSTIHSTVKQLLLFAPQYNLLESDFTGSAYKFEITLVDQYDPNSSNILTDRVLINNLAPILDLKDKNFESVFVEDAIYTEQLAIIVPSLPSSITAVAEIDIFMFDYAQDLVFDGQLSNLTSGTIVEDAGNYEVRIYAIVNQNYYLLSSTTFMISQSSQSFFEVLVRDTNGELVPATITQNVFTYNNIDCYQHYIVNSEYTIFLNKNQYMEIQNSVRIDSNECTTYVYLISNFNYVDTYNILPHKATIAVSYIPKTTSIITSSMFSYELNDSIPHSLNGTNAYVTITQSDASVENITVKFNSYYAIPENIITATISSSSQTFEVKGGKGSTTSFVLSNSGDYTITFTDLAGNTQLFTDINKIEQTYFYKIRFIKGVAYLIDGKAPIQNAIYNDSVQITLDNALSGVYDPGGKPSIVVYKNDQEISVSATNGVYNLAENGYYKVFFNARVGDQQLRQEAYEFLIISSKEFKTNFEFSEYGDYEISKVIKNGDDFTPALKRNYNLSENDALKTFAISLYDEKTGSGNYKVTILTNSGLSIITPNGAVPEFFEFEFNIKSVGAVPIKVSLEEGATTTNEITVEFNAYDLYQDIGECKITFGNTSIWIDEEYLAGLNNNYYTSLSITETGTYFVQVYNASDSLLYSYKVIKAEPLNAVSIMLIIGGVAVAVGLTVTIVLLRKRMKIK